MVCRAVRFASRIGSSFLGHKMPPLPNKWPAFCFARYLAGELMHDSKIFTEMIMKFLVGKGPSETSYSSWNKDSKHRRQAQAMGIFENIWIGNDGPLPWRLTAAQRRHLDQRMKNIVWPHYMESLCYDGKLLVMHFKYIFLNHVIMFNAGASVWMKPNRITPKVSSVESSSGYTVKGPSTSSSQRT